MHHRIRAALTLVSALVFCLALPRPARAQDCDHAADRSAATRVDGIERVHVIAHAGSLEVTGRAGSPQASARGRACVSHAEDLDDVTIDMRREGSTLVFEVTQPDRHITFGDYYARMDLVVDVPEGMDVVIEDGSGDMTVRGVGDAVVSDGSGSIDIRDVRGSLALEDGSGDIEISGVAGHVDIDDGSGSIAIANVRGDVEIDDGSGDVRAREVGGSVRVEDGSGDIRIMDVTRNVLVDDGSGSIRVEGIGGDFVVDDDGSGSVDFSNVSGRVRIPDDD